MMNTMKEKIANALSEARYEVRMRLSNLEVALEQCKREEENLLDMEANHERLVKEWEEAKSAATAAKENENSLAEQKKSFFTSIDTSKKVSFKDMEEEYQKLCKELTSATRKATKAENKASTLGEELLQLEAAILALVPTKEEPKEEAETNSASTPAAPVVKKEYPTRMKLKTNKVFTKEDGTKLVFFKKYDGSLVKYDAAIREAASMLLPEKEYDVEGHWSSDKWTFYVDRVLDNGKQVVPIAVSVPAAEELNKETHGVYNAMAEAFAKANAKKMA